MAKIIFIFGAFIFFPILVSASTAGDFIVNPQSTYDVPPGTTDLLILDLTLPNSQLKSIKITNDGTLQQREVFQLSIYEDGSSPGWDGDELEKLRVPFSPFFDADISGDFTKQRIFITLNVTSTTASGRTIKPELGLNSTAFASSSFNGPTDKKITGLERKIVAGTDIPYVPISPLATKGEAISTSTIRWYFTDLSNNEFGFKILDENLKIAAEGPANISYLDETGLEPDTEYSGRQVKVFNDKGQSSVSTLTVFSAVKTLSLPVVEVSDEPAFASTSPEVSTGGEASAGKGGPFSPDELRAQIQEIQMQIIELLGQLIQLLQEQISSAQASLFRAFGSFTDWLQSRF